MGSLSARSRPSDVCAACFRAPGGSHRASAAGWHGPFMLGASWAAFVESAEFEPTAWRAATLAVRGDELFGGGPTAVGALAAPPGGREREVRRSEVR